MASQYEDVSDFEITPMNGGYSMLEKQNEQVTSYPVPAGRGQSRAWLSEDATTTTAPADDLRLGPFTVMCLIFNRMIGTGIFSGAGLVVQYTQSPFISVILWFCGCIMALAGMHLFLEYGLSTPRIRDSATGQKLVVPKSGGELVYLKYLVKNPPFFAICVFGISYIILGNVSANCINFGIRVLQAAGYDTVETSRSLNWVVRVIAIVACFCATLLHSCWRMGGVFLNNIFACVKVATLLMTILLGFLYWGQVLPGADKLRLPAEDFGTVSQEPYAYARAFLTVVFAMDGFNQANYVMGEVSNPKRHFRWPAASAVLIVCALYLGTIIAYMVVVPADIQKQSGNDVALSFFQLTLGTESSAKRTLNALLAVSSLGNIIVMTFIAARVKQEIAKEGILPFRKFLMADRKIKGIQISRLWGAERRDFYEYVPLGGLVLHFTVSVLGILLSAINSTPNDSYSILVLLYSYSINSIFGVILGVGILWLRLPVRNHQWRTKSDAMGLLSIVSAVLYAVMNLFPAVVLWWKPSAGFLARHPLGYQWFVVPVVGVSVLAFGVLWWLIFFYFVPRYYHRGKVIQIKRQIEIERHHDYVMSKHETIDIDWVYKPEDGEYHEYEEIRLREW